MRETSDKATSRRRRIKILNAIGVVVAIAAIVFLRLGLKHLPESAQWPLSVAVLVGVVAMMAVFTVLVRRQ